MFPWAAYIIFLLTGGDGLFFLVPILVLTVGDTAAAIIGQRYGRIRLEITEDGKTLEGSMAFIAFSFLGALFLILGLAQMPLARSVAVAFAVAVGAAIIEALSTKGLDNLTIPIVALFIMDVLLR